MLIKVAIVQDDEESTGALKEHFVKYAAENGIDFDITCFTDGDEITSGYSPCYHMIFMDVQMKRQDGLSAARQIRKTDSEVIIVFITRLAEFAIEGYLVSASGFLLKPVPYNVFERQIKRLIKQLNQRAGNCILLATENGLVKINVRKIVYAECFEHKVVIHTKENTFERSGTIKELEEKLPDKYFFRCNKSYLVNLAYVSAVKGNKVMIDEYSLVAGGLRKKAFIKALTNYVLKIAK